MSTLSAVEEHGFFILPDLISPQDVKSLTADLGHSVLRRSKAGVRHALSHPVVAALASDVRMLNIAQEILGGDALPFRATLFDKSAEANWLVAWHQDTALPLRERWDTSGWRTWSVKDGVVYAHAPARALCQVLALRLHLDDSDAHNGPLRVLPRTHTRGVLTDDEIEEFAAKIAPVECLVPQGGILAMRPLLIHASSKSRSETPRRVLHIEYAASNMVDTCLELAVV